MPDPEGFGPGVPGPGGVPGGGVPAPGGSGPGGPGPGGLVLEVPDPGGCLVENSPGTATAAGDTHPTGMHSCCC